MKLLRCSCMLKYPRKIRKSSICTAKKKYQTQLIKVIVRLKNRIPYLQLDQNSTSPSDTQVLIFLNIHFQLLSSKNCRGKTFFPSLC